MTNPYTKTASGIPVWCSHSELRDITELIPNPRNPNQHPDKQIALLAKIIRAQGWRNPITVSDRSGFIVKGHGRLQAAQLLQVQQVPVDIQHYDNEAAEYADMIADNRIAELAEVENSMLKDLLQELDNGSFDMDLTGFDVEALEDLMTKAGNPYTTKIETPIYSPKGLKPKIDELADHQKTDRLIEEIKAANLPEDEKAFLMLAAQRHTVFNYEHIAEYYSHASATLQDLMERSALVIIDFDKAIENGYVRLTKRIKKTYSKDYQAATNEDSNATE